VVNYKNKITNYANYEIVAVDGNKTHIILTTIQQYERKKNNKLKTPC
jgi:hypothetical protein